MAERFTSRGASTAGSSDIIRPARSSRRTMSPVLRRFLICIFLATSCVLFAQDAAITGIVSDSAQAVMPGVAIKLRNTDTNITRTVQTNQEGSYTITNLPPGPYELTAEMQGFSAYRQTGIVLQVDQVLRANLQLT